MTGPTASTGPTDPLDRAQWDLVLREIGAEALGRYAGSYLDLLAGRLDGIERAVAADGNDAAARIMSDLSASSAMLGARRFAALTGAAEARLRSGTTGGPGFDMRALRDEADAVERALRRALGELAGPPTVQPPNR
jgi:HPt (histidine-containing phosphotransfer) domain-containing protein